MGDTNTAPTSTRNADMDTILASVTTLSTTVTTQLTQAREASEKAAESSRAAQEASTLSTEQVTKLSSEVETLKTRLAELDDEKAGGEVMTRLDDLEKLIQKHARTPEAGQRKRAGQIMVESELFESLKSGQRSGAITIKTRDMPRKPVTRAALTSTDANGNPIEDVERTGKVVDALETMIGLDDILPRIETSAGEVQWIEETTPIKLIDKLAAAVAIADTTLTVSNARAFVVGTKISVGGEERTISAINVATNVITVDAFTAAHAQGVEVTADKFAYTAETELKPELEAKYEEKSSQLETIAGWIPVSNRLLKTASTIVDSIERKLPVKVRKSAVYNYLYGDGQNGNMLGFFSNTNIPAYLWSNGVVGDTKRDAVRRAMTGLYDLGVMPNYVVLNPFDAEDIELAKDDHGQYIMGMSYTNQNGQMMLWNVRVILCGLLKRGDFLVGDFNQAPVYYNEEMTLRVAEQHADFFVKNMVVMLAEQLEVLIVEQPQAFRRGSFNEAPQAG